MIKKEFKWYGWRPDTPDFRDHTYKVTRLAPLQSVNLQNTTKLPPIMDQGPLGSCTGNAISYALSFNALNKHTQKRGQCKLPFSRLFIYYNERLIEGTVNEDAGAEIRDGLKSVAQVGCCSETVWKYNIDKFCKKPTKTAYKSALKYRAISYERLDNTNKVVLVNCLLEGFPFVFGFSVYNSFESPEVSNTGVVNMPTNDDSLLGGHAVTCVGYDMDSDRFIIANSWGTDWGQKGFFTIPADYLINDNLAADFWTIKSIL